MNNNKMISNFVKERNEALFSLDEEKIRAYSRKYGISLPDNPRVFWGSVYKAVLNITTVPDDVRIKAEQWLDKNNFSRGLGNYYCQ